MKTGWQVQKIGSICVFQSGKTIDKSLEKTSGEILYVKVGDMNLSGNEEAICTSTRFVNSSDVSPSQILPIGSVIFPKRGGAIATNKKRKIIKPTIVDLNTMAIVAGNLILPEYLFHWFRTIDLAEISNGTSVPQINNYSFDSTFISYPESIPEQKQIVAILDEAFDAIDQAKSNIEKNIQNAQELFQSKLNEIFSQRGEGWQKWKLGEICKSITDGDHQPPPKTPSGVPFITISNIDKRINKIDFSNTFFVPTEYYEQIKASRKPSFGDVLYTVTGSFGIPVLIDFTKEFCFQRHIGLIRPSEKLDSKFLYYWILSPNSYEQANEMATGTAQRTVSLKSLRRFTISVPSRDLQKAIVENLDILYSHVMSLEETYDKKLTQIEELKKSLLQKAFSGELTKNFPAEIKDLVTS